MWILWKREIEMNTYTLIFDFRGGKYIYQQKAQTKNEALLTWAKNLEISDIQFIGKKVKQEMISDIEDEIAENTISLIDTTENVWICCLALKTGFAIIHIIKTDISTE